MGKMIDAQKHPSWPASRPVGRPDSPDGRQPCCAPSSGTASRSRACSWALLVMLQAYVFSLDDSRTRTISDIKRLMRMMQDADGFDRCVKIIEKIKWFNGEHKNNLLWARRQPCMRSGMGGGNVKKRFFPEGAHIVGGTDLLYVRDHLGSIREVTDTDGNLLGSIRLWTHMAGVPRFLVSVDADFEVPQVLAGRSELAVDKSAPSNERRSKNIQ